jgi:hypothetical protein
MLKVLRILTGTVAIALATVETVLNAVVYRGKPLAILLDAYVLTAWLLGGALFPHWWPKLLVSGWGVMFGHSYGVLMENLAFHHPPTPLLVTLGTLVGVSLICLCVAIHEARATLATTRPTTSLVPILRFLSLSLSVFLVASQLMTSWGKGKPLSMLLPYYLIAAGLVSTVLLPDKKPLVSLSIWSVASGFFYVEWSGFLVFFETPVWVIALASVAVGGSLIGLVLQSVYLFPGATK